MSAPRRSRWRRWTFRLLLAAVAARVLLALFLVPLLRYAASFAGLELELGSASLCLLGGSFRLEQVTVRVADAPAAPPLLLAKAIAVDLAASELWSGRIVVADAEFAGAEVQLRREADGSLLLPRAWLEPAPVHVATPTAAPTASDAAWTFQLPVALASVRVHDVRLCFDDRTSGSAQLYEGTVDVRVRDVGVADRTGELAVRLHSPRWFDDAWLTLTTNNGATALELQGDGALTGVRPAGLPLPAEIATAFADVRTLAVTLHTTATGTAAPTNPRQPVFAGGLQLEVLADEQQRALLKASLGPAKRNANGVEQALQLSLQAPEWAQSLTVRDAALTVGERGRALRGNLELRALRPTRLLPWLASRGIAWPTTGLDLGAYFDAELGDAIAAELRDVSLVGDGERFELALATISDLRTTTDELAIGDVRLWGPQLTVLRTNDGALGLAGLRLRSPLEAPAAAPAPKAAAPFAAPTWPRLRLGTLHWSGANVQFTDASLTPPATLALGDTELSIDALTLGAEAPPGRLVFATSLADAIGALRLEAELTPSATSLRSTLQLTGDGITANALAPWLAKAGLVPTLQNGSLRLLADAEVRCEPTGALLRTSLSNLAFVDGEQPLLRVRSLRGDGVRVDADGLDLGSWRLGEPFVACARGDDGHLALLGMRTTSPAAAVSAAATAASSNDSTAPKGSPTQPATATPTRDAAGQFPAPRRHGELVLERGVLQCTLPGREPPLRAMADAVVGRAAADTQSTPLTATLQVDGIVRSLRARANLVPGPSWQLGCELDAEGLRGDGLAGLLPPDLRCTLVDGAFHLALDAKALPPAQASANGGLACELRALRLTDRGEELLALDQLSLPVRELGNDDLHLGQLTARGLRGLCTATSDGTHFAGLLLAATTSARGPATASAANGAPAANGTPTANGTPATNAAPTATANAIRLPLVRLDGATFELERLVVRDRRGDDGEPLIVRGSLRADAFAPRLDAPSPLQLTLRASALPLCRELAAELTLEPYAVAPTIDGAVRIGGLSTTKLAAVSPSLASKVQGTSDDLTATARLHARLDLKRRDPRSLDPTRAFAGELSLTDVAVVDGSLGPGNERSLAKIGEVDVVLRAFDPASGDLLLRSVHVDDVQLAAVRSAAGLDLLGLRLLAPNPEPNPAASPAPAAAPNAAPSAATGALPGEAPPARPVATSAPEPSTGSATEFAVDQLQVAGLSIDLRDETTTPPTHLPFADVEFELERFTTRALREPLQWQFRTAIRGGPVALEKRVVHSSLLTGLVGSAGAAVLGGSDRHETEARPLVDEIRVRGELQLFPALAGRIVTDIAALELPAFRGLAKATGVELTDGVLDHGSTLVLRGDDGLALDSSTVLTWLSLREPPGGPISTYLRLPAPLDTVLFLLRNDADEQRLPLRVRIDGHRAKSGEVTQAAVDALVAVIADAVASAGKRAGGMVTGALGLGGDGKVPELTAQWPFAVGDPLPPTAEVAPLLAALRADPTLELVLVHELGSADLARAGALTSPSPAAITATIASLRVRHRELLAERAELAPAVLAAYDTGRTHEARTAHQRLAGLDQELGELERALDEALGMLGEDSPRQQRRRASAAAIALGQKRLAAVAANLRQLAPELPEKQIQWRRPRSVPTADLPEGGVVRAMLRRRTTG